MMQSESEKIRNNEVKPEVTETEETESLKQTMAAEKAKSETYLANWQRAQADFINFKRRSEQEREEVFKLANATLMLSLLPILDDLERAFSSIPPHLDELTWVDGIRLIDRKLRVTLEAQGLTLIKAQGEPFDPNLHEAVMHRKGKEGIVIEELQKGYKLYDKVIRPAMVAVGNGEEVEKEDK